MSMIPNISIIIPVYNTESFIRRCLDSVMAQYYRNWELVVVDDGSTDDSGAICDEYAKKDERIRVFHKENGGVSSARNVGLQKAIGEWVTFIDSDDWVEETYLQNYVDVLLDDIQMVVQGIIIDKKETTVIELPELCGVGRKDFVELLESTKGIHNGFIWHKAYRTDIIRNNNVCFDENLSLAEDGVFNFQYLNYVEKINVTGKAAYHYVVREGSLTSAMSRTPLKKCEIALCGMIDNAISWNDGEDDIQFEKFVRRLCWRIVNSWFVERALAENDSEAQRLIVELIDRYKLYKIDRVSDKLIIGLIKITSFHYPKLVYRCFGLRYRINHLLK